jgi:cell fate regulator YaaT (PSP1 superfamily)
VARATDIEKWEEAKGLEQSTMLESRQIAERLNLNMKIGDVEYQGDRTKAIFYYIADERVDFRELIKVLADRFKVRIEMKQIGARQEAGRIGGIGPCGRELCCASWMTSFVSVTTHSARIQDISLNPLKLAGQCGKLKCCLNYELDVYLDAIQDFPPTEKPLDTDEGLFYFLKYDIFKKIMYYSSKKDAPVNMVALDIERVAEIQKMNEEGHRPDKIGGKETVAMSEDVGYSGVVELDDLTRFDDKNRKKKGSRNRNNGKGSNRQNNNDRSPQNDTRRQRNNDSHNRDNSQSQNVVENDQRHDNATNTEPHNGNRNRQRDNRRGQNGRERRHRDNDAADSNNDGNNEQK